MRIHWKIRHLVLAALICFLTGAFGLIFMYQQGALAEENVAVDMEKTFDGTKIDTFSISTDVADTTFILSDNDQITVKLSGHVHERDIPFATIEMDDTSFETAVDVRVRTGRHYQVGIDVGQIFAGIRQGFRNDLKVVVELPDKVYAKLDVKTDTGDLALPKLQAETLNLASDTGDVTLEGFSGKRLTATTDTGTMRMKRVTAELELSSDTGDFYVEADALPGGANMRTDTGDIHLTMSSPFPVQADFESDTGDITASTSNGAFNFDLKEKHKVKGQLGSGGPLIKARTDTGDIVLGVK